MRSSGEAAAQPPRRRPSKQCDARASLVPRATGCPHQFACACRAPTLGSHPDEGRRDRAPHTARDDVGRSGAARRGPFRAARGGRGVLPKNESSLVCACGARRGANSLKLRPSPCGVAMWYSLAPAVMALSTPLQALTSLERISFQLDREREGFVRRLRQQVAGGDALATLAPSAFALQRGSAVAITGANEGIGFSAA